ncbi:hypothetical protein [Larkinella harenae]
MFVYFQVISPAGNLHDHTFACFQIEFIFTILNEFVATNFQLISAYLIDESGGRTTLPVEAFDGVDATDELDRLQREYRQLVAVHSS